MRISTMRIGFAFAVIALLALGPSVAAAGPGGGPLGDELVAPKAFGINPQWVVLHASEFDEETQMTPGTGNVIGTGYMFPIAPGSSWWKQLELPAGSQVLQIVLVAYDNNQSEEVAVDYCEFESALTSEPTLPVMACYGLPTPPGTGVVATPSYTQVPFPVPAGLVRPIMDVAPFDGLSHFGAHHIIVWTTNNTGVADPSLQFFAVAVEWMRTISPAPGVASFTDVPVGAFGFQHIEALYASGITGGCGGGNYCPNQNVTRAQMAVFLAKGLGLDWPQ